MTVGNHSKIAQKILVLRGGALGDFILTLPAISALRKKFPEARLEILGSPPMARLAIADGLADDLRSIDDPRLAGFFSKDGNLSPEFVEYFSGFSLVISYLFDLERIFQKNFARISSAKFIAGPHRPDEEKKFHATEVFLQPLNGLGICDADLTPKLSLASPNPGDGGSKINFLALHPGSGSERKNWPEEKWAELICRLIAETNVRLFLIGGEAEGDRLQRLSEKIPASRFQIAQNLPLVDLARRMKPCSFFLGHDSGISHLAAALDLPGLILWGETNAEVWRPRSLKMKLLRAKGGLREIPVSGVFSEVIGALQGAG